MSAPKTLALVVGCLCLMSMVMVEGASSRGRTYEREVPLYRKGAPAIYGQRSVPSSASRFVGRRYYLGQSRPRGPRYQLGRPIGGDAYGHELKGRKLRYEGHGRVGRREGSWVGRPYYSYQRRHIPRIPDYGYYGYYGWPYPVGTYYYPYYRPYGHYPSAGYFLGRYRRRYPSYYYPYSGSYIYLRFNW